MYIPNDVTKINLSVDYNRWLKRLDAQLNEPTNQNLIKVSKVVKAKEKKRFYKTLRTRVINSPMPSSSLFYIFF